MPQLVLDLLKYLFLVILYLFMARAVRIVFLELRPAPTGSPVAQPARPAPRKSRKVPRNIAVVEGSSPSGRSFELGDELTVGRDDKCHIVLDDPYASQVHARLYQRNGAVFVEDLGSTNGTYLNRTRVTAETELHRGDQIKIGRTVLELRK